MHLTRFTLFLALACAGCRDGAPPKAEQGDEPVTPSTARLPAPDPDTVAVETLPSPNGRATLVLIDSAGPHLDVVLLIARGDTSEIFGCGFCRTLGLEWLTPDLGRVWIPIGGHYHHSAVFAQASTGRWSPPIEDDLAVDVEAGTLVTYDNRAFTLRDLWTGRALGSWSPPDLDLRNLWQECEPTGTLAGREAIIRYDCGDGVRERAIEWKAVP
jgi:hypothetical protein